MWFDADGKLLDFPPLAEDEELNEPEPEPEPAPPPPPPRIRTRYQQWCDFGIPEDVMAAQERLKRARRKRKECIIIPINVRVTEALANVVYDLSEEYDVSVNQVMFRLVTDGLRSFAKEIKKPELVEKAELKSNPFDEIPSKPEAPAYQYTPVATPAAWTSQAPPLPAIDMSSVMLPAGAPLTRATAPEGDDE